MCPVLDRPPRALCSRPVNPEAKAPSRGRHHGNGTTNRHSVRDEKGRGEAHQRQANRQAREARCPPQPRDRASGGMWQRGKGQRGAADAAGQATYDSKHEARRPWDWETSRHGVGNPGPTMEKLGHGKFGQCPEPRDGREVSAGVRADVEAPSSRARVHVGSRMSGTPGNVETVAPWPPAADGRHAITSRRRVGTPTRERWGVVECG